jgi:class 3 adenylate cyclase
VESTALWIQGRAQMYSVMRRHDQLLTAAIESNGGIVLKERGEGDSFFAVFLRATDAVVAALDAQKAILSEPWRDEVRISVRMAVLTGEADAQDRDYRSPAVNRCAKLRRRAVGNQVLVSESTYSIVADILRDDVRLVSIGKRRLEGHERPEEIYVLQHPEVALETMVAGPLRGGAQYHQPLTRNPTMFRFLRIQRHNTGDQDGRVTAPPAAGRP